VAIAAFVTKARRRSVASLLALAACACGSQPPDGPGSTPTRTPAPGFTQTIRVLTSDGRELGTLQLEATGNQLTRLTAQDLRSRGIDTSTVDSTYFVLRYDNLGDHLGSLLLRTMTGELIFAPSNTPLILWMMNATNNANYGCAAATPSFLVDRPDNHARYASVQRLTPTNNSVPDFTVVDGDTSNLVAGLELLNRAWNVGGVKYAELHWVDDASGEILGGLGRNRTIPSSGYHIDSSFVILPAAPGLTQATVTVEEALEVLLTYDDLCGMNTSQSLFQLPFISTDLSPTGKDLVRFGVLMRNLR